MKKLVIIMIILTAITAIYKAGSAPEWVKVNAEMVQACQTDASVICD